MNPEQSINGPSQKIGVHVTNWSPWICIAAIRQSVPSAHLRITFWPPWQAHVHNSLFFWWDQLLEQADITLNILRQDTDDPSKSAWEYLRGRLFNYDTIPLSPLWIPVIIQNKPSRCKSWDYIGRNGFSTGVDLNHYCCQRAIDAKTKALSITETIEF